MIDTHCHIDDEQYAADFDAYIAEQKAAGVEYMLVPSVDESSLQAVPAICSRYPDYCFPAIGLHPEEVKADWQQVLQKMHNALTTDPKKWIAIGEIGLDYHFDVTYKEEQQAALREQLSWAISYDLPVMIHSRDATADTLNILGEYPSLRGVMHCFSGSHETAKQIVKMGLYLGIGGVITFKNSKLADNLVGIPLNHIVLETDAPYMAPTPNRGKRNESRWIKYVIDKLAEVYGVSAEEIDRITTLNAKKLFQLK